MRKLTNMKRKRRLFLLLLPMIMLAGGVAAWGTFEVTAHAQTSSSLNPPGTQQGIKVVSPLANGQWTTPEGDLAGTRFSPLSQINAKNVAKLRLVANIATGIPHGHEGNPLVVGDTMYMITPFPDNLLSINLKDPHGPLNWTFRPHPSNRAVGVACCDVVNRGGSYAAGKVVYATLDGQVVAVNAKTGKEMWRTKVANPNIGETITMAPLIVKDRVIVGNSGGELGVRGKDCGLDLNTGKVVWCAYATGPDKDVLIGPGFKPYYKSLQGKNLGVTTWVGDQWKHGGGTQWGYVTYDPETNLIFYGTGNPAPWNPDQHKGKNLWTCSVMARDPETGQLKWAYQFSPHDSWDYDSIMENIAVDMEWKGQMRKLLIHPGRTGFVYVLDRTDGQLLSAEKFMPSTNWASGYDLQTGLPHMNPAKQTHQGKDVTDICPSSTGAKEFVPSSFDPRTGLLYISAHNTCMDYKGSKVSYIAGTPYLGATVKMYPGPGGFQGELVAWDVANAKPAWTLKQGKFPLYSGVLSTGGDVVFFGTLDRWFRAVDAHTGKILWQFQLPSGIIGNPMTYVGPDGKQYVAVYYGIGGWMGAIAFPSLSTDDPTEALGVTDAMKGIKKVSAPGGGLCVFGF